MEEEEIKARFTEEIKALGVSKNSIAEKIGFSAQTFTNISSGRNMPGILLISRIKKLFPSFDSNYVITGSRDGLDSAAMEELDSMKKELQRERAIGNALLGKSEDVSTSPDVRNPDLRKRQFDDMKKSLRGRRRVSKPTSVHVQGVKIPSLMDLLQ